MMQPGVLTAYNERITREIFESRGQGKKKRVNVVYNSYFEHLRGQ